VIGQKECSTIPTQGRNQETFQWHVVDCHTDSFKEGSECGHFYIQKALQMWNIYILVKGVQIYVRVPGHIGEGRMALRQASAT
jgi:hypothetical protein